ncbi:MAG: hypothetical protein AAGD09_26210, partial [Cyanobacteria bacterium P01_F01_bin.56]
EGAKSSALSAIATASGELGDASAAQPVLTQALTVAEQIEDEGAKSSALSAIATASGELGDASAAQPVLTQVLTVAEQIESEGAKSSALRAIAMAYGELGDASAAQPVLTQALTVAEQIESEGAKSDALSVLIEIGYALPVVNYRQDLLAAAAVAASREATFRPMVELAALYAQQRQWGKALAVLYRCRESEKIVGLARILTAEAEHKNLHLIPGALVIPRGAQGVNVLGQPSDYQFEVTVQSHDENCERYADWVEVLTPDGMLKGRQVFEQPHDVNAQNDFTFAATISGLDLQADEEVVIRSHFHGDYVSGDDPLLDSVLRERGGMRETYVRGGYTDQALRGSVAEGFRSVRLSRQYAQWLENDEPLPQWETCQDKIS